MKKQWYVIRARAGFEHRVKRALELKIRAAGRENLFGQILVPTEKVIVRTRGKRETVERRLFPGYVLAEVALNEETWNLIRSVPKVGGLLGEPGNPLELPEEDVRKIVEQVEAGAAAPRPNALFFVGEKVRVVDGPFREFSGTVESVKPGRSTARVALSVFGRPTPVEVDFSQLEAA